MAAEIRRRVRGLETQLDRLRAELALVEARSGESDDGGSVGAWRVFPAANHEATDARPERRAARTGLPHGHVERYCRQVILPGFGAERQRRLADAAVLIIGAGGLGCPAAMYLAAAGVRCVGIVDRGDAVERSNLHRQVAHVDAAVGVDKCVSLATSLQRQNPDVEVRTFSRGVAPHNVLRLLRDFDVVLDCTDNVRSRYMISDGCALLRKPLVCGSAIGMDGQLTVYCLGDECPCYRCVFPAPPPARCVGSCDSAGVLGPVPGVIGTLQAVEALKILAGIADCRPLAGRLLLYDGRDASAFRSVRLRGRRARCIACDTQLPEAERLLDPAQYDYEAFSLGSNATSTSAEEAEAADGVDADEAQRMSVQALHEVLRSSDGRYRLVDVRPPEHFSMCALPQAVNIPLAKLPLQVDEMAAEAEQHQLILICRRGVASAEARRWLHDHGVRSAVDVIGGLQAWHAEIDPTFPSY